MEKKTFDRNFKGTLIRNPLLYNAVNSSIPFNDFLIALYLSNISKLFIETKPKVFKVGISEIHNNTPVSKVNMHKKFLDYSNMEDWYILTKDKPKTFIVNNLELFKYCNTLKFNERTSAVNRNKAEVYFSNKTYINLNFDLNREIVDNDLSFPSVKALLLILRKIFKDKPEFYFPEKYFFSFSQFTKFHLNKALDELSEKKLIVRDCEDIYFRNFKNEIALSKITYPTIDVEELKMENLMDSFDYLDLL